MENITASSTSSTPLLQPEGLLFPSIFWSQSYDGSIDGAIPISLFQSERYNKQVGFAGLENMLRTRITDGSLLTSSHTSYLQFVFDCLLNLQLSKTDIRIVLNRGWQELGSTPTNYQYFSDETFKFDCAESRKNVCEVAALIRDKNPTYFVTYTCGQSTHPGLRKIFQAIDKLYPPDMTSKELRLSVIQSELMPMLRCWHRASQYVMQWLKCSAEQPLGPISHLWMRYEWQDETSAFPHIHALVCTGENKFGPEVQSRVCCSKETFMGALSKCCPALSDSERFQLRELFHIYQRHDCGKGKNRCKKKTDWLGKPVCRVPKYPASVGFSFKEIQPNYSKETWDLLRSMKLSYIDPNSSTEKVEEELKAGKHHYPAAYNEHMSPTNAALFAFTESSTNVQICDDEMCSRYVAKYAAGVEGRAFTKILASAGENEVKVQTEPIVNKKIAGVQTSVTKKRQDDDKRKSVTGRIVSITECLWWALQLPYVCTNIDFIHVPTVPKEFRSAIVIEKKIASTMNFSAVFAEAVRIRKNFLKLPKHRQLTKNQELLLADVEASSITPDKVTIFGLRPPELLFVSSLKSYFSWFVRFKYNISKGKSSHDILLSRASCNDFWVDCLGYVIKIRPPAIFDFLDFCATRSGNPRDEFLKEECRKHIVPKLQGANSCPRLVAYNLCFSDQKAIVVFTNTLPSSPTKFLLHFVLTFGSFDTELDILSVSSLGESFVAAKLVERNNITVSVVRLLARRYLLQQLRFVPGSSKLIDKFLLMANSVLGEALLENNLYFASGVPAVLDRTISADSEENVAVDLTMNKSRLVEFLHTWQMGLPSEESMIDASVTAPVAWKPDFGRHPSQTVKSYCEQTKILKHLVEIVDLYRGGTQNFVRHQIIAGAPGTGKTFIMLRALSYAICQGLNCMVTSLAAERSAALAGKHLNALIPFPVEKNGTVNSLSRLALSSLQKSPDKSRLLQNLDVLFVEEISMISSELWAATDHVFQIICSNYVPFAGKLIIATGDFFQLPPPKGSCLISSSFPLITFHFSFLQHFVRMQNETGQKVLSLMSTFPRTTAMEKQIWNLIERNCNFVECWDDVPNDAIRIFATRKAERYATLKKINQVKDSGSQFHESSSTDEMCVSSTDNWIEASGAVTKFLNKKCLEPQSLFLFPGAILRLTVNKPNVMAFQGQLCVLVSLDSLADNGTVTVALAPAGCRSIPPVSVIRSTWRCIVLAKEIGVNIRLNHRTICRRIQFPLKLYVASTIHKTMGETLPTVARQIVGAQEFSLWLPEQLYVVMSRVRSLVDITFVGSKQSNEGAILSLLSKKSQWSELSTEILQKCSSRDPTIFHGATNPFPSTISIPQENVGYCYLIQSVPQNNLLYIGSTMCLNRRIREHNVGLGASFTQDPSRRPWVLCAYVTGFLASSSTD